MALKFFDKLSQNLTELLNDGDDYNVIIEVENKEKSFTAHSNILKFRSSYFRRELENIKPENNNKIIIKSSISAQIFNVILQYIYGGIVDLENCETRLIYDLMLAADEFEIEELTNKLETLLIETKDSWLRTHFSFIYHFIFNRHDDFKKLKIFCNDIVLKYPKLIFDADDFTSLEESALISLLKRNDLQMEEVKIWDYVIKWGIAQTSTLPTNLDDWTKENFFTLKTTLQQCLPHIRYFHLSSIEVVDKIEPYRKILDKQLWKDINRHLLIPERPVKSIIVPPRSVLVTGLPPRAEKPREPFSSIISDEHAAEISTWIDRRETAYNLTNIPYKFELILRGTRDGFAPQTFWNMCHGHACTVVLVKVKRTDEILGGYNPLSWDNSKYYIIDTRYAFCNKSKDDQKRWGPETAYNLTNIPYKFELILRGTRDGFAPQTFWNMCHGHACTVVLVKVKRTDEILGGYNPLSWDNSKYYIIDTRYAFCNKSKDDQKRWGPCFSDLQIFSDKSDFTLDDVSYCRSNDGEGVYEKSSYFSIVDYEVFKIVRKTI
ncbi:hypothetical protein Glove_177g144 [Diversispora epigaea]|uniref:BTB domain-containing protein n=1 Tax=Diversispora epigaea TaxID=1348612 RepID=A0A397IXD7_9GLOM|nr:hypothetical protein Glove_177g144 [Diversispora epigaea]